jgi:thiol-disulfide isomerase/thioredoxin
MKSKIWLLFVLSILISEFLYCQGIYESAVQKKKDKNLQQLQPSPKIGEKAKEIEYPNPDGEIIKLSSLQGKVVLLEFWASWCYPCRLENPELVKVYHEYKNKGFTEGDGFTIYSVSLDKKQKHWVKAIKKDKLLWPYHVSALKGWECPASYLYGVESIPANFLINREGIVISKNLKAEDLKQFLDSIVKK